MDREKITGKKRFTLFKQLVENRTLLNLHLIEKNYERITLITQVIEKKDSGFFLIDYPRGFREALNGEMDVPMIFQFTGPNRIPYLLKTFPEKISGDEVWIKIPKSIEKIQRRREFRIPAPSGTKFLFQQNETPYQADVVNVSFKGSLLSLHSPISGKHPFQIDGPISNARLISPGEGPETAIAIKKAFIKRIEKDSVTGKGLVALQFSDLTRKEKKKLGEWIYQFQRILLQEKAK